MNDPAAISARTLCSMSSSDGVTWSEWKPYAGILQGHYQSTGVSKTGKIGSSFNFHPNDSASRRVRLNYRSNLYYMETKDSGKTWQNAQGESITVPLRVTLLNPVGVVSFSAFNGKLGFLTSTIRKRSTSCHPLGVRKHFC